MITVKQLMQMRGENPTIHVSPSETVFQALQVMADANVGAIMVIDQGQMVGIFTERDYARKIILKGRCSLETPLREIMTTDMITIHPETTLEEVMELMTTKRIRHLPVMEGGRLVGMVSMRDVVQAVISAKERTIEKLESYILGEGYAQ
jgi:CBS domain-containing protein